MIDALRGLGVSPFERGVPRPDRRFGDITEGRLSEEAQQAVDKLRKRDAEVRAHEQAHVTAGGPYAGVPSYTTTRGPDGQLYAIGGEVSIDVSPVANNPKATVRKMEQVKRAALAPADPSSADRAVAAQAQAVLLDAQSEATEKRETEKAEFKEGAGGPTSLAGDQQTPDVNSPKSSPSNARNPEELGKDNADFGDRTAQKRAVGAYQAVITVLASAA